MQVAKKLCEKTFVNKKIILTLQSQKPRGVAQLAARHVRDVEVGSSSLLTPTQSRVNLLQIKKNLQEILFIFGHGSFI